jgi:hypothetical protein
MCVFQLHYDYYIKSYHVVLHGLRTKKFQGQPFGMKEKA